jgi:hypothetical protein
LISSKTIFDVLSQRRDITEDLLRPEVGTFPEERFDHRRDRHSALTVQ